MERAAGQPPPDFASLRLFHPIGIEKPKWNYASSGKAHLGGNRVYVLPEFRMTVVLTKSDFRDRNAHEKSDQLFTNEIAARLRR